MEKVFGLPPGSYLCTDSTQLEDFELQEVPEMLAMDLGYTVTEEDSWWSAVQWLTQHHFGVELKTKSALLVDILSQIQRQRSQ